MTLKVCHARVYVIEYALSSGVAVVGAGGVRLIIVRRFDVILGERRQRPLGRRLDYYPPAYAG